MEINYNKKYNFKVSMNQFGIAQNEDFFDPSEVTGLQYFEKMCLKLRTYNKSKYTILELGSNQCYYTIMFNAILGKEKVITYILEPNKAHANRSIHELELNNISYTLIERPIGDKWIALNQKFDNTPITIDEIFTDYKIDNIDLLHSDIDGAEIVLLDGCHEALTNKKIDYIFMLTHAADTHEICKQKINKYDYKTLEHTTTYIGADRLIMAKKN